jgi:hypothetical protein
MNLINTGHLILKGTKQMNRLINTLALCAILILGLHLTGCSGGSAPSNEFTITRAEVEALPPMSLEQLDDLTQEVAKANPDLPKSSASFGRLLMEELKKVNPKDGITRSRYPLINVTSDEFWLLVLYRDYISPTRKSKSDAEAEEKRIWGGNYRNGRSDGFRHAYVNTLLAKRCALWWADAIMTAHESETPASEAKEKAMDLNNNAAGRNVWLDNKNATDAKLSDRVRAYPTKKVSKESEMSMRFIVYLEG